MIDIKVLSAYMRGYAVSAISNPNITVDEIADKLLLLVQSSDKIIPDEDLNSMICEITRTNQTQRCFDLVDTLITKQPSLEQGLFSLKAILWVRNNRINELINAAQDYENKYGRDADSISALINGYMIEGYEKHQEEIDSLVAQLQEKVGI
jgi:hypothetical protein